MNKSVASAVKPFRIASSSINLSPISFPPTTKETSPSMNGRRTCGSITLRTVLHRMFPLRLFVSSTRMISLFYSPVHVSYHSTLQSSRTALMFSVETADGDIRLFRSYESPEDVKLISSFQGISETIPTSSNDADAGLVVEWQQGRGQVLMGGNVKYIRVWDATRETVLQVSSLL